MANLEPGTVVQVKSCPNCGQDVQVKLNKNRIAYFYCSRSEPSGAPCSHHERFGRAASQRMQDEFINKTRKNKALEGEHGKAHSPVRTANDTEQPRAGGFLYG